MIRYSSYEVINDIMNSKLHLKKDIFGLMKKDKYFKNPRIKFETITFSHDNIGYGINFGKHQRADGVTTLSQYSDYKKIRRGGRVGYSYTKTMLSDAIWPGDMDYFTGKDAIEYIKDTINRYGG